MTKIGAGGKFDKDSLQGFWRIAWSWCICCNALSNHLRATVHSSDGKIYEQNTKRESVVSSKTNWRNN
jgi:DNA gyrase subunit B